MEIVCDCDGCDLIHRNVAEGNVSLIRIYGVLAEEVGIIMVSFHNKNRVSFIVNGTQLGLNVLLFN